MVVERMSVIVTELPVLIYENAMLHDIVYGRFTSIDALQSSSHQMVD